MHDVCFAFGPKFAGFSHGFFGAVFLEIVEVTDTCGDEATFKIGMDSAGGFGGGGTFFDSPGTAFFFASSKERLETECVVGGFDEFAEGVVFDAVGFEKFFALVSVHARHFFLEFGIDEDGC